MTICPICAQSLQAPSHCTSPHGTECPFTLSAIAKQYGSVGAAAGAVAIEVGRVPAPAAMKWPAPFQWLVLCKQQHALLKLAAVTAGTSMPRLQEIFKEAQNRDDAEG